MAAAFSVVFAVFVLALVVLGVVTLRWAIRRDKVGRAAWLERRRSDTPAGHPGPGHPGPGHPGRGEPRGDR